LHTPLCLSTIPDNCILNSMSACLLQ
jgi:hypothetical protein